MPDAARDKEQEPRIKLTVISGPDAGLSLSFAKDEVSIGRAPDNDFVLSDGFVSSRHGELLVRDDNEVVYRDLGSRHGSLIVIDDVSHRLQEGGREESDPIGNQCEAQVGCTLIQVDVTFAYTGSTKIDIGETPPKLESDRVDEVTPSDQGDSDKVITQALKPVGAFENQFDTDNERLAILFQLAGRLNGLTALDEILELVVDATFDAFPNANFFAITLVSDPDDVDSESPFFTRTRGDLPGTDEGEEPIISSSIVEHVVESQESILFLKDSAASELTDSILEAEITSCLCAPLVGQRSLLGVVEVDTRGEGGVFSRRDLDLFSVLASIVAFAIERAKLSDNIVEMFESFVAASVDAIEARDPTTAGHSQRVTQYTLELAQVVNDIDSGPLEDLELSEDELTELRYAALLHDFGKIAVDEHILQKGSRLPSARVDVIEQRFETIKGLEYRRRIREATEESLDRDELEALESDFREFADDLDQTVERLREISEAQSLSDEQMAWVRELGERTYVDAEDEERPYLTEDEVESLTIQYGTLTDAEWEAIKSHPTHSEKFLERIPWSEDLERIPNIAGAHHEKLDGSGYPRGRDGSELIPQVRMMTIADIFDALTASDRPYRDAFTVGRAVDILRTEADEGKLDPDLVEVFAEEVLPTIDESIPEG